MRHAAAASSASSDRERPLTDAGASAARDAGRWLAAQGLRPDLALVSEARRAQETWAGVCAGADYDPSTGSVEPGLYSAGPEAVLDLIHLVDDDVRTLVVVGHNPTMSVLAMTLDDGSTSTLLAHPDFRPGAMAVFELDGPWADLTTQGARATEVYAGRG